MFIFSENVEELINFYTGALELEIVGKLELPEDYGYAVRVAPNYDLWLADHSRVSGENTDKFRHMLNLYTDRVKYFYNKVKNYPGVEIIQKPIAMSKFNPDEKIRYVCTFTDPEGNCLQVMGRLE